MSRSAFSTVSVFLITLGFPALPAQAAPDVSHYDLDLTIDPDTLFFDATATLSLDIQDEATDQIELDFVGFEIESISADNQVVEFERSDQLLTVYLPELYQPGSSTELTVTYTGNPEPYITETGDLGVLSDRDIIYAINVTDGARHWFPCRDQLNDKATSDLRLRLPPDYRSAGPGHLESLTADGPFDIHYWKMEQEVTPYLLSFAFSDRYISTTLLINTESGVEDAEILLLPSTLEGASLAVNTLPTMVDWLTRRYGAFPYDQIGLHEIPFPGAVEQPGNIAMGSFYFNDDERLLGYFAHELSHTWFQGLVTAETWQDVWLSEGAAAWHELLWTEESQGLEAADTLASTYIDTYRVGMASEGIFPLGDPDLIFGYTTYMKGSTVFRLLEHLAGRQELLSLFQDYFADEDGIANIDDFFALVDTMGNGALNHFKEEWIDRAGLPDYEFAWTTAESNGQIGLLIEVDQGRGELYTTPIDFSLTFEDGHEETIIIKPDSELHGEFICLSEAPVAVQFDPRRIIPAALPGELSRISGDASTACFENPDEGCNSRTAARDILGLWAGIILLPLLRLRRRKIAQQ